MDDLSALNERLDEVGWSQKSDWQKHTGLIFKWMQQATLEIDRLNGKLEAQQRILDSRTQHLV